VLRRARGRGTLAASAAAAATCSPPPMPDTPALTALDHARRHGFEPIAPPQQAAHLPPAVAAALDGLEAAVFACRDEHSDTAAFCAAYGCAPQDCANTLIVKYARDGADHHAAIVSLGSRRLDLNGAVKQRLGARRLSLARREVATQITGMAFGGITAPGLPAGLPVLVDAAVLARPWVVMGAGVRETKLLLAPAALLRLPDVEVAPLTFEPNAGA